jgi:hypothetical protein
MRFAMMLVLGSAVGLAGAQTQETGNVPETAAPAAQLKAPAATSNTVKASVPATGVNIPAGTKVPLSLKQAISTKTAKEGDAVYAETTFPVVVDDKIIIPPGTYVQGKISQVKRGGHVKGRAELLIHFTSMIYPSGYTVLLPGSLENVPGAEKSTEGFGGNDPAGQPDRGKAWDRGENGGGGRGDRRNRRTGMEGSRDWSGSRRGSGWCDRHAVARSRCAAGAWNVGGDGDSA